MKSNLKQLSPELRNATLVAQKSLLQTILTLYHQEEFLECARMILCTPFLNTESEFAQKSNLLSIIDRRLIFSIHYVAISNETKPKQSIEATQPKLDVLASEIGKYDQYFAIFIQEEYNNNRHEQHSLFKQMADQRTYEAALKIDTGDGSSDNAPKIPTLPYDETETLGNLCQEKVE